MAPASTSGTSGATWRQPCLPSSSASSASILINYYWIKDLSFALEVGAKWTEQQQAGATHNETDLFFTPGFRYDF